MPTTKGIELIGRLRDVSGTPINSTHAAQDPIASPQLTGQWEKRLNAIWMEGEDPEAFMDDVRQFVKNMVADFKTSNKFATLRVPADEVPSKQPPQKYATKKPSSA